MPEHLEISLGDTVIWINEDLAPHTATALDGSWETEIMETGQRVRVVFGMSGVFDYFCAFHPHMNGSVFVRSKPSG